MPQGARTFGALVHVRSAAELEDVLGVGQAGADELVRLQLVAAILAEQLDEGMEFFGHESGHGVNPVLCVVRVASGNVECRKSNDEGMTNYECWDALLVI